ncbi:MAG TPA: LysR family transcriptional regulator [Ideonella sp.]|nr:LysR family transcriptional regulator [Ideonella sp.]
MSAHAVSPLRGKLAGQPELAAGELSLRRLRAFVAVAGEGSVSRAALQLHIAQSAVTRAVQGLEADLGMPLFHRSSRAMAPTEPGELVLAHALRALAGLDAAQAALVALAAAAAGADHPAVRPALALSSRVSQRHLQALTAVVGQRTETAAAAQLGLSQPAITLALRELECLVGTALFHRSPRGMEATPAGALLVGHARQVLEELAGIRHELASRAHRRQERLVVGVSSMSGMPLAPVAVSRLAAQHPELHLSLIEAPWESLVGGLLAGEVDVIVGALPSEAEAGLLQERLFDDQPSVVARCDHPLAGRRALSAADLAGMQWVLPYRGTPSRLAVDAVMAEAGLGAPAGAIEAGTLATMRGLLTQTDRVSLIWRSQGAGGCIAGLATLPFDVGGSRLPVGFSRRAAGPVSVGLAALLRQLRDAPRSASRPAAEAALPA